MKKNIPFNNQIIHIILFIVLILYIIADILIKNWSALIVMTAVGLITYYLDSRKNIVLMMMIVMGCVYRTFFEMREGMKTRKKKKIDMSQLDGVEGMLDNTMKQHQQLLDMATQLQPLMKNAGKVLKGLPEGFLDKALANLKN